ncbi:hypothetical protein C9374_002612 [Naegleria lovaniensis]|uniref:Uncharacterized protein n=1 Tax=Naegleria lovaniensis TaxID=51637 RepID=A0AA88GUR3_NAELO|nr:uncharacterized protein C9374_002612 [Naegleria lovaniensis]KAG2386166.1 hypothetical protein C9374_002612 [Naegleria lovaniensis]
MRSLVFVDVVPLIWDGLYPRDQTEPDIEYRKERFVMWSAWFIKDGVEYYFEFVWLLSLIKSMPMFKKPFEAFLNGTDPYSLGYTIERIRTRNSKKKPMASKYPKRNCEHPGRRWKR